MSLKTFLLGRMNKVFTRSDLPPRHVALHTVGDAAETIGAPPPIRGRSTPGLDHLGAYRPLVGAIREELERFVAADLRLHLAIAERDRYVLTLIEIESVGNEQTPGLLKRFIAEFAPEQVKQYLAREIIARLPNASAIDLTQFAGLHAADDKGTDADHAYDDLIAELRSDEPVAARPYEVTLVGRWSDMGRHVASPPAAASVGASPVTPLAGQKVVIEVADAGGVRRVALVGAVPGRRYVIGKDPACDVVVDGVFASRRHCEIWLDAGTWWVTDCGSTNGVRVDPPPEGQGARGAEPGSSGADGKALAVVPGASIVLSASSRGDPDQYPRLVLQPGERLPARPAAPVALQTPLTPIVPPPRAGCGLVLAAQMASGSTSVELPSGAVPFGIGRSRSQALVVDWAHEGVSGHHVDIVERDERGAQVHVRGDNGVTVAGVSHASGSRFRWNVGETMLLGRAVHDEPQCAITLSSTP